jgi:hypothetical protein
MSIDSTDCGNRIEYRALLLDKTSDFFETEGRKCHDIRGAHSFKEYAIV